jgi:hypothetical protein
MQVPEDIVAEDVAYIAKSGDFVTMDDYFLPNTTTTNCVNSYTNDINTIADDILQKYHTDSMPEDIKREYKGKNPTVLSCVQNAYNRLRNNSIKARELRRRVEGKLYDADTQWGREEDRMEQLKRELAILNGEI